jgi:hypothetical protein
MGNTLESTHSLILKTILKSFSVKKISFLVLKAITFSFTIVLIVGVSTLPDACTNITSRQFELSNSAFRLSVNVKNSEVQVMLKEIQIPLQMSEGNYIYRAQLSGFKDTIFKLQDPAVTVSGQNLTIRGKMAGLDIEHNFYMLSDKPFFEEHIVLHNSGVNRISFSEFEMGFPLAIKDRGGKIVPELSEDRIIAVPFRHRADDTKGIKHDYRLSEILEQPGWEYRPYFGAKFVQGNSRHHFSEGWAWIHGYHHPDFQLTL